MPIPVIGTLGDLNASDNTALNSQRWAAQQLSNLGGTIADNLATQRAQQDAVGMAPLFAQHYQDAYNDISQGHLASGVGKLIQIGASTSTNPFLKQQGDQAVKIGLDLVNQYSALQRQQAGFNQQYGLEAARAKDQYNLQLARDTSAQDRVDAKQAAVDARQDERVDAQMYNGYQKQHAVWANQMRAFQAQPELFNNQAPQEPDEPAYITDKFKNAHGQGQPQTQPQAQGQPQGAPQDPQSHYSSIKADPTSQPNPQVLQQSQANAQKIAQTGAGTKTFELGDDVASLIGGNISFPASSGVTVSKTGNSNTGEIHTTITQKDAQNDPKLKQIYEPAIKAASELSNNTDLVKFIKGPDGNGNIIDSNIGVQGVVLNDDGQIVPNKAPLKGKYDGYVVYKVNPDGEKEFYTATTKGEHVWNSDTTSPVVLEKDDVAPISILKSLPSTAVALGGSLQRKGDKNNQQPATQDTQPQVTPDGQAQPSGTPTPTATPQAQPNAPAQPLPNQPQSMVAQGNVAPEGTVRHGPNGSKIVKQNGQWVAQK